MSDEAGYPGQGKDIPAAFGRGAWIYEPALSLSLDDRGGVPNGDARSAVELDAGRIAASLAVSIDELLEANSTGKLTFSNRLVPPRPGDASALEFVFRIGAKVGQAFVITMGRIDRA